MCVQVMMPNGPKRFKLLRALLIQATICHPWAIFVTTKRGWVNQTQWHNVLQRIPIPLQRQSVPSQHTKCKWHRVWYVEIYHTQREGVLILLTAHFHGTRIVWPLFPTLLHEHLAWGAKRCASHIAETQVHRYSRHPKPTANDMAHNGVPEWSRKVTFLLSFCFFLERRSRNAVKASRL